MPNIIRPVLLSCLALLNAAPSQSEQAPHPNQTIVLIIDGLRPDSITPDVMPNVARLKAEGTFYPKAHSVFPSVTRVNSAAISTGMLPDKNGIVSNTMFVKEVNAEAPFNTADYTQLLKLAEFNGGRLLPSPTLAELVEKAGLHFVAMSSGSTGSGFLLNPEAPQGTGVVINGGFDPGKKVAFPNAVNETILKRFGAVKSDEGVPSMEWTERVLRDYVLPELHPDVLMDWITEPDTTQHRYGAGSPQAIAVLKKVDEQVGLLIARLRELHREATTNIVVVSDHGFSSEPESTNLGAAIARAADAPGEVIVANNGESALLFVKNHSPATIKKLVSELYKQTGVGVMFTAAQQPTAAGIHCSTGKRLGWVHGTFSLDFIRECNPRTGADILIAMQWNSKQNPFGVKGIHVTATMAERAGDPGGRSGHGGFSPWSIGTTMILHGPSFKERSEIETAAGNVDIMPTLLASLGVPLKHSVDGRVLREAFRSTHSTPPPGNTHVIEAGTDKQVKLRYSQVSGHTYLDAAWQEQ